MFDVFSCIDLLRLRNLLVSGASFVCWQIAKPFEYFLICYIHAKLGSLQLMS